VADERLWAPWRLEYIKGPKPDYCIFCERRDYVVAEGELCFVTLNAYPYTNGHVMVSPYEHADSIEKLGADTLLELMTLTQQSMAAIRDAYGPDGFNLGVNQGGIAGAGVEDHVHLHVVPRWGGDTNFMPVVGGVRVLPQSLEDSYKALTASWPSATA
jgi:ATP adenylyltransferase